MPTVRCSDHPYPLTPGWWVMPMEAIWSEAMPAPFISCPKCGMPFDPFMRGQVARFDWFGFRKRIWCVICRACKGIVGHEDIREPRARFFLATAPDTRQEPSTAFMCVRGTRTTPLPSCPSPERSPMAKSSPLLPARET